MNNSIIEINPDELKKLQNSDNRNPFLMLNMLKFKEDGGKKKYAIYVKESEKFVSEVGAEVFYLGKFGEVLTSKEDWDVFMLVKYPSREAFLKLINNPEYIKVHKFRDEALERAILYPVDPMSFRDLIS